MGLAAVRAEMEVGQAAVRAEVATEMEGEDAVTAAAAAAG